MRNIEPETKTIVDDASHLVLVPNSTITLSTPDLTGTTPAAAIHTHNDVTSFLRTGALHSLYHWGHGCLSLDNSLSRHDASNPSDICICVFSCNHVPLLSYCLYYFLSKTI